MRWLWALVACVALTGCDRLLPFTTTTGSRGADRQPSFDLAVDGARDSRHDRASDRAIDVVVLSPDISRDRSTDRLRPDALRDRAVDRAKDTAPADAMTLPDMVLAPDQGVAGLSFVQVFKPGSTVTFLMGAPAAENCSQNDEDQHTVTLSHAFEIAVTETTQSQYAAYLSGANPSTSLCTPKADCPVDTVSWHDAVNFCNTLSVKKGLMPCYSCGGSPLTCTVVAAYATGSAIYFCPGYRLPTEAEWEYAYRAGTTTGLYNGEIAANSACTGCSLVDPNVDKIGYYTCNTGTTTKHSHPVKGKAPNGLGLYDMAGNLGEWCHDWYAKYSITAQTDPAGPATGTTRVNRGGSWYGFATLLRAAARVDFTPSISGDASGFRCARSL